MGQAVPAIALQDVPGDDYGGPSWRPINHGSRRFVRFPTLQESVSPSQYLWDSVPSMFHVERLTETWPKRKAVPRGTIMLGPIWARGQFGTARNRRLKNAPIPTLNCGGFPPHPSFPVPATYLISPDNNPFILNRLTLDRHSRPGTLSTAWPRSPQRKSRHRIRPSLYSQLPWERFSVS